MEIQNIENKNFNKAKYAFLNKNTGSFEIIDHIIYCHPNESELVMLKDVSYKIYNNCLYIKGKRIYHCRLQSFSEYVDTWTRVIYILDKNICDLLESPPQSNNVTIRRFFIKKIIHAYEPDKNDTKWYEKHYKYKQEDKFYYITSNFKLHEK
jgi:hypothetical protein